MITPGMNRQQRRAAIKQARHAPPRTFELAAGLRLLHNARPYDEDEMVNEHTYTRECFKRLLTGQGTEPDFDRVGMILNCGLIRAEQIDKKLVWSMQAAGNAMARMKERYLNGHNFGFDAQGLEDTRIALDDFEVIMDASSPLQMKAAIQEACSRIMGGEVLTMADLRQAA